MGQSEKPVDLQHLNRYTGGERALDEEILKLFENQCHEMMAQLERLAGENAGTKAWREVTHTLKGAARGIGAFPLAAAAAEAETTGPGSTAAIQAVEAIKLKAAAVYAFIDAFVRKQA